MEIEFKNVELRETMQEVEDVMQYYFINKAYNTSFSYKLALKICKLNLQKRTLKIAEENLKYVKDTAERMERQFNGES